ncbi:MAG: hypothetical protein D6820_00710, partial [Lentisphaerae bacterium]
MLNIAVFMPYNSLFDNTRVLSLTQALACRGVCIDIFTLHRKYFEKALEARLHRNIRLYELGEDLSPQSFAIDSGRFSLIDDIIKKRLLRFVERHFYDYLIGVDPMGLVYAHWFAGKSKTPFAYLIHSSWRQNRHVPEFAQSYLDAARSAQKNILPEADLLIIPDGTREKDFLKEAGIPEIQSPPVMQLPSAVLDWDLPAETTYWHQVFDISPERRIVLAIGEFNFDARLEEELLRHCRKLRNFAFVFHGSLGQSEGDVQI